MEQEINNIQEKAGEKALIQAESKDLFENYEMGVTKVASNLRKIIAGTIAVHILAIFTISQTGIPLGSAKPCQNPLMQTVCEVIDAAYVGGVLMTTDRTSVDAPYEKTELEDAEITFIDVTNAPPAFTYPEGYFANEINAEALPGETLTDANGNPVLGELALNSPNSIAPGIPGFPNSGGFTPNPIPSTGTLDPNKPADLPKGGGDTLIGDIPGITSGTGKNPIPRSGKRPDGFPRNFSTNKIKTQKMTPSKPTVLDNNSPGKLDLGGDTDVANTKPRNPREPGKNGNGVTQDLNKPANTVTAEAFNKKPLKDFGREVNIKIASKKIDLNAPVALQMKGVLTNEGKLDPKKSKFENAQGNPELVKVIQSGILAINDSGYLKLLDKLSGKTLDISFAKDDTNIIAEVQSEMENDTRAKTTKTLLDLAIQFGKDKKNKSILDPTNSESQNDKDELALLEKATVEVVGKKVIIRFNIPNQFGMEMIARKLKELADDEAKKGQSTNKLDIATENKNANIAKK
jgi:hypothetical protein